MLKSLVKPPSLQQGAMIVEFMLILPILLFSLIILTEVGRLVLQKDTIADDVYRGITYAAHLQNPFSSSSQKHIINIITRGQDTSIWNNNNAHIIIRPTRFRVKTDQSSMIGLPGVSITALVPYKPFGFKKLQHVYEVTYAQLLSH